MFTVPLFIDFANVFVAIFFPLIHLPLLVFVLPSRGQHGSCLTFMHSFLALFFGIEVAFLDV